MGGGRLRILQVYIHYPISSGRYYTEAFQRAGHDVRHIGDSTGNQIWGMDVDLKYIHQPDGGLDAYWDDWQPDLIILHDTALTGYKHPKYNAPMIVVTQDNHVRNVEQDGVVHYFLAHYHGPAYPVDPTRADHSWLPCASDPMFTPSPIPWENREYDVACVGVMYPRRLEVVNALRDAGLKVFTATGLLYEEYRAAYWNSRISLCVSAAGDVAQRIFETGRMGCAILTDPLLDFADEATNKALGIYGRMTYTNPQEAATLARELLGSQQAFNIGVVTPQSQEPIGKGAALQLQKACMPHIWDARAQVIVDWFQKRKDSGVDTFQKIQENLTAVAAGGILPHPDAAQGIIEGGHLPKEIEPETKRYPMLNLGCGRTHFPSEPPPGHEVVDPEIYRAGEWLNVDKVEGVGADKVFDLFTYPWPLEDNSFDGAVLGHIVEHIPHEIKLRNIEDTHVRSINLLRLANLQDGWFAFFAELYRVLTPGAIAHIISPYGWSDGAITDPTHTRYLTINTFHHGLSESQYANTFKYNIACNFEVDGPPTYRFTPMAAPFMGDRDMLEDAIMTRLNMVYDFYVRLKVVK